MTVDRENPVLRVFACPAWNAPNPYSAMLADALVRADVVVTELENSFRKLPRERGILLFHWPNQFFFVRSLKRTIRALMILAGLWYGKLFRGQKIVWIAHNLLPHERDGRPFTIGRLLFFAALDGIIFLSRSSRDIFIKTYPRLANRPFTVISHGDYRPRETSPSKLPERVVGRAVRLAFVGRVMRYKGPDLLARLVVALPPEQVELIIAGKCGDGLEEELVQLARTAPNLRLRLAYLSDAEIEQIVDGADAIALPYRDIMNSGSALLALSRNRPVIAPRLGSLVDLLEEVGSDWLWLYDGSLTRESLAEALTWVATRDRSTSPDLSGHDWPPIGVQMVDFLQIL